MKGDGMEKENLLEKLKNQENEKQELLNELRKLKRRPERTIGLYLFTLGIILLTLAILTSYNISALIGIGLVLIGAILLYIRPIKFVRKDILEATAHSIKNFYQIIDELGYNGTPQYISPNTLWGQKNTTLYIPKSDNLSKPTDEILSTSNILVDIPDAIKLIPPGQRLSQIIEKELRTNLSTVDINYLQNNLEKAIVEGLEIAYSIQILNNNPLIQVKIRETIFYEIIKMENEPKSMKKIGDPLTSSIACTLAQATRKPIIIENMELKPNENAIEINYKIMR
jgi:hypothetical protein